MRITKRVGNLVTWTLLGVAVIGCDSSSNTKSSGGASMSDMAAALDAKTAAEKSEQQRLEAERKAEEARQAADAAANPQIEVVTAHSPKKGRSLEGGGYLSVVAGTRFWAEHQIILDNITYAMKLYQAEHGRFPKDQEEFMNKIIKPNLPATRLPELPEGWEYYYDPEEPLPLKMINRGGGAPEAID
jgi:hypothetical protein